MFHAPSDWIRQLRALAAQRGLNADAPLALDDLDGPFRAALKISPPAAAPLRSAEAKIWHARCDTSVDINMLIDIAGGGPLLAQNTFLAIEVWTDAELSALHALAWLAHQRAEPAWADRLDRARLWHLDNTQPDNATNRPWAIHVFVRPEDPESMHYAQTLLHNAIAQDGIPTVLGAWILEDCARALEQLTASPNIA